MKYGFYRTAAAALGGGLPLDNLPSPNSGLNLEKVRSTYTGACLRVRRSSDNALQDIGFFGNELDSVALLAFVGSGDGFVHTWYDQGFNNNNFVQTVNANQPRIVISGGIRVDGIDFTGFQWLGQSSILFQSEFTFVIQGGYDNYIPFDTLFLSQTSEEVLEDLILLGAGESLNPASYVPRTRVSNGIPTLEGDFEGFGTDTTNGTILQQTLRSDGTTLQYLINRTLFAEDLTFNTASRTNTDNRLGARSPVVYPSDSFIRYFYIFPQKLTDYELSLL